jgi:hypothetical protein
MIFSAWKQSPRTRGDPPPLPPPPLPALPHGNGPTCFAVPAGRWTAPAADACTAAPRSAASSASGYCWRQRAGALKVISRGSVWVDAGGTVAQPQLMRRSLPSLVGYRLSFEASIGPRPAHQRRIGRTGTPQRSRCSSGGGGGGGSEGTAAADAARRVTELLGQLPAAGACSAAPEQSMGGRDGGCDRARARTEVALVDLSLRKEVLPPRRRHEGAKLSDRTRGVRPDLPPIPSTTGLVHGGGEATSCLRGGVLALRPGCRPRQRVERGALAPPEVLVHLPQLIQTRACTAVPLAPLPCVHAAGLWGPTDKWQLSCGIPRGPSTGLGARRRRSRLRRRAGCRCAAATTRPVSSMGSTGRAACSP